MENHRINHEKLLAYVKEHPGAYLREIAAHFSGFDDNLERIASLGRKEKRKPRNGSEKRKKI